jgi:hypothetical protein
MFAWSAATERSVAQLGDLHHRELTVVAVMRIVSICSSRSAIADSFSAYVPCDVLAEGRGAAATADFAFSTSVAVASTMKIGCCCGTRLKRHALPDLASSWL